MRNPVESRQWFRSMSSTDSGACRPLFVDMRNRCSAQCCRRYLSQYSLPWQDRPKSGLALPGLKEGWNRTKLPSSSCAMRIPAETASAGYHNPLIINELRNNGERCEGWPACQFSPALRLPRLPAAIHWGRDEGNAQFRSADRLKVDSMES